MTIDGVKWVNLKGAAKPTELELSPRVVLIGPNGSGKSTVSAAISLLLDGHVHGGGKTSAAIMQYAQDPSKMLGVNCLIGDKRFGRSWWPVGKTITEKFSVDGVAVKKNEFIISLAMVRKPRLFDIEAFRRVPAGKRVYFLLSEDIAGHVEALDEEIKLFSGKVVPGAKKFLESLDNVEKIMVAAECIGCAAGIALKVEKKKYQKAVTREEELKVAQTKRAELISVSLPVVRGLNVTYENGDLDLRLGGVRYETQSGGEKVETEWRLASQVADVVILEAAELDSGHLKNLLKDRSLNASQYIINTCHNPGIISDQDNVDDWTYMHLDFREGVL